MSHKSYDDDIEFRALHEGLGFHAKESPISAAGPATVRPAAVPAELRTAERLPDGVTRSENTHSPLSHLFDLGLITLFFSITLAISLYLLSHSLLEWTSIILTPSMLRLWLLVFLGLSSLYFLFFKEFKIKTPGKYLCQ